MDFPAAIRSCLSHYATFSGRARRSEYWYFILFAVFVSLAAGGLDAMIFGAGMEDPSALAWITGLALFLPSLAVAVRRLHDIGRGGWWILLGLVPLIGPIVLIVFYAQKSEPGANRFGPDPLGRKVIRPMAPPGDLSAMTSPLPQVPRRPEPPPQGEPAPEPPPAPARGPSDPPPA